MYKRLYVVRSEIPAVTHIDYTARIHTVNRSTNPLFWQLINSIKEKTGIGGVVNTSFNIRGEPIVCSPDDAYVCFMSTSMDYLVIGNNIFNKLEQPLLSNKYKKIKFKLD